MSIPADNSQPACALSGERFETFWDDAHEEWRFRDAVRLTPEQAARCACCPTASISVIPCSMRWPRCNFRCVFTAPLLSGYRWGRQVRLQSPLPCAVGSGLYEPPDICTAVVQPDASTSCTPGAT